MSDTQLLCAWLAGVSVWWWLTAAIAEACDESWIVTLIGVAGVVGSWWWMQPHSTGAGALAAWMGY